MTTYTTSQLAQHAGSGSSLELIGRDEDSRPVFAGYWDDGTPCVMVGEPGSWFDAWSGEPMAAYGSEGQPTLAEAQERFDESLAAAHHEARKLCGMGKKTSRRK